MPSPGRFALILAALLAATVLAAASPPPPGEADWRTPDPANLLLIETTKGKVIVELTPLAAPASVEQIRALARTGFYDGRAFFRVVDGFMDQTGDPQDNGQGGSTRPDLPSEFTFRRDPKSPFAVVDVAPGIELGFLASLPVTSQPIALAPLTADGKVKAFGNFCPGVVGIARAMAPESGNSQFFLMRAAAPSLDQNYTPIGRAIIGLDVIRAIKIGAPVAPPQDRMISVKVVADLPPQARPKVRVVDPAGPWMKAQVERVKAEKVVGFTLCDIDLPAELH